MIRNISQRIFNRLQLNFSLLVFHLQVISPMREYSQVWIRVLNGKELLWNNTYVILHPYFWGCSELFFVFRCWEALKRNLNSANAVLDKYIYIYLLFVGFTSADEFETCFMVFVADVEGRCYTTYAKLFWLFTSLADR